jgi:hypothetical protein|tara:strand:+ start:138 stop:275 length:138 start_codon:yes stop_codon:yes gene_type:complete
VPILHKGKELMYQAIDSIEILVFLGVCFGIGYWIIREVESSQDKK